MMANDAMTHYLTSYTQTHASTWHRYGDIKLRSNEAFYLILKIHCNYSR